MKHRQIDPDVKKAEPCPFCLSSKLGLGAIDDDSADSGQCWIYCHRCSASGPVKDNADAALKVWNVRRGV